MSSWPRISRALDSSVYFGKILTVKLRIDNIWKFQKISLLITCYFSKILNEKTFEIGFRSHQSGQPCHQWADNPSTYHLWVDHHWSDHHWVDHQVIEHFEHILSLFALLYLEIKIFTAEIYKNRRFHGFKAESLSSLTMSNRHFYRLRQTKSNFEASLQTSKWKISNDQSDFLYYIAKSKERVFKGNSSLDSLRIYKLFHGYLNPPFRWKWNAFGGFEGFEVEPYGWVMKSEPRCSVYIKAHADLLNPKNSRQETRQSCFKSLDKKEEFNIILKIWNYFRCSKLDFSFNKLLLIPIDHCG